MIMYFTNKLQLIYRQKLYGPGLHYGALLPDGRAIDFSPTGIRLCSIDDFTLGHKYFVEKEVDFDSQVQNRLTKLLEGKILYDFINFNCEHFARFLSEGKVDSKQVKGLIITSLIALLSVLSR